MEVGRSKFSNPDKGNCVIYDFWFLPEIIYTYGYSYYNRQDSRRSSSKIGRIDFEVGPIS